MSPQNGTLHWIDVFETRIKGMLQQVGQLPQGRRQRKVRELLVEASDVLKSLRSDPSVDDDANLALFSGVSVPHSSTDENFTRV